jgi:hypothetical protein
MTSNEVSRTTREQAQTPSSSSSAAAADLLLQHHQQQQQQQVNCPTSASDGSCSPTLMTRNVVTPAAVGSGYGIIGATGYHHPTSTTTAAAAVVTEMGTAATSPASRATTAAGHYHHFANHHHHHHQFTNMTMTAGLFNTASRDYSKTAFKKKKKK